MLILLDAKMAEIGDTPEHINVGIQNMAIKANQKNF